MGKQISLDEKDQLKKAAIDAVAKLGGPSRIARKLGVSPWAVSKWRNSRIPAERVLQLVACFSGQVAANELRPDLYPNHTEKHS